MGMIEKIELLMRERNIDKPSLARSTDIPYTTIDGLWKKGTENMKRSTLLKLARYFDCTIDYLADDDIEIDNKVFKSKALFLRVAGSLSTGERKLIDKYRALDERGRETVNMTIDAQMELAKSKLSELLSETSIS